VARCAELGVRVLTARQVRTLLHNSLPTLRQ
jgi:hypothetical protein